MGTSWRLPLLVGSLVARVATGQGTGAVHLQLRPHAGDTLRVRLDQTIETGRANGPDENVDAPGDAASLTMLARIVIEGADPSGATALVLADSVRVTSVGALGASPTLRSARALQGQRFRFRLLPDGGTMLAAGDQPLEVNVGSLFAQLPATLPREPQAPGTSWVRAVELPLTGLPEGKSSATLNATFRFDSLVGDYAHLSVRGRLVRSGQLAGGQGGFVQTAGDVTGKILIDLRRGWIADARSVVTLRSLVTPGDRQPPARVRVRITQWMRVM